uniref:Uncharacterized protein n=1 Tax=Lactuca sativa TaxID=4236 RepID=A0A9R1VDI7_LACSA|nr:hypothetical protein LSAT_V11C500252450 [Lactuca sativa]
MPLGSVVVYANGHRAEVQGGGDVLLKFMHGECVSLRDVLDVCIISKWLVSMDKFDNGGFKMVLVNGKIAITKGRRYVGSTKIWFGMYHLRLNDEGSASKPCVESNCNIASVASVSCVSSNDVMGGFVANVNEVNFFDYFVCLISLWYKPLAHTNVKNIETK